MIEQELNPTPTTLEARQLSKPSEVVSIENTITENEYEQWKQIKDRVLSDRETQDHTLELKLESKLSRASQFRREEPKIHINNVQNPNESFSIDSSRRQAPIQTKAFSRTHPPMAEVPSSRKVVVLDIEESQLSQQTETQFLQRENSEETKQREQSAANQLSKPQISFKKKVSLQLSGQQDFLLPETDSMIVNSLNSQQENASRSFSISKKIKSDIEHNKRGVQVKKGIVEGKIKSKTNIDKGDESHTQGKSLKKVTFIGDSSFLITQQEAEQKHEVRQKSETQNSLKDDCSMTSILQSRHGEKKKTRSQQSSRKIISQDENYCLFRLIGPRKSERVLMCRSVEIKDETTEYKQLKVYLLCRQNQHENIVKMHSYEKAVRESNKLCVEIKMDYYPKNLEEYVLQNKRDDKRVRIERKIILFQILKALNFIHPKNICHRDLNPHSIMISDQLHVAITNFAYARQSSAQFSPQNYYECNFYVRPPEVILQPANQFQSGGDIWSFGCVAVYMVKGQMPFFKAADSQMMLEIIRLLGPPGKKFLESINFQDHKRFVLHRASQKQMRQIFRCDDERLLEMLRRVFLYEPAKRAVAAELMASDYFLQLRHQQTFNLLCKSYEIRSIFDFKPQQLAEQYFNRVVPAWYTPPRKL